MTKVMHEGSVMDENENESEDVDVRIKVTKCEQYKTDP